MLEEVIKENTAAVRELLAAILKQAAATSGAKVQADAKPEKTVAKTGPIPGEGDAAEQGKTAAQAVEALKDTTQPAVPYTDVANAITNLARVKGKPAAVELLGSFNVARGPELKPDQYADVLAAIETALA
jgi:hypothetical protein